jgi:D-glycero-alpha-D-manno-heptose-7-phosphate kinase
MHSVTLTAPTRICDCGGWTDTWFAGRGAVLNIAVWPGVTVRASATPGEEMAHLTLASFGETYSFYTARPSGRHPIIEAAIEMYPLHGLTLTLEVSSDMPPGASTGTSAAVAVAVIAALKALGGGSLAADDLARAAHRLETERLALESGVQDQIAAARGGVNFIEIVEYPNAVITPVPLADDLRLRLDRQLSLVYLGRAHLSPRVHEAVIAGLGRDDGRRRALNDLERAACQARDALLNGDLVEFGRTLRRNVEAQGRLHPSLVSETARAVGALADATGAIGWKVNGAGGDGGSVAVLFAENGDEARIEFATRLARAVPGARVIPVRLADGRTEVRPAVAV